MKFTIYGEPMGKQRPKARNTGKFIQIYTPKETTNYESKVIFAFQQGGFQPFKVGQEIKATIVAYFKIPKSCYRFHKKTNTTDLTKQGEFMLSGHINPIKKPDLDNIAKIVLDALNGIAYPDDSQVVQLEMAKKYSEQPRVEVILNEALQ